MCCCSSRAIAPLDDDRRNRSKHIDSEIKQASKQIRRVVCFLLLGAGESGKSTVVKQMRVKYDQNFTTEERIQYQRVIRVNLIQSLQRCIESLPSLSLKMPNLKDCDAAAQLRAMSSSSSEFTSEQIQAILHLCSSDILLACLSRSSEFLLNDSAPFMIANAARICAPNFEPTTDDILRARVRTLGVREFNFQVQNQSWKVVDVGGEFQHYIINQIPLNQFGTGQRSERRKWLSCFENVQVMLFLFAVSEFDQFLEEDQGVRRYDEALMLLESITNSVFFAKSAQIWFLNKCDLLEQKLQTQKFADFDPHYSGPNTASSVLTYLRRRMRKYNRDPQAMITIHTSPLTFRSPFIRKTMLIDVIVDANGAATATDTHSTDVILSAIQNQIIVSRLDEVLIA